MKAIHQIQALREAVRTLEYNSMQVSLASHLVWQHLNQAGVDARAFADEKKELEQHLTEAMIRRINMQIESLKAAAVSECVKLLGTLA